MKDERRKKTLYILIAIWLWHTIGMVSVILSLSLNSALKNWLAGGALGVVMFLFSYLLSKKV